MLKYLKVKINKKLTRGKIMAIKNMKEENGIYLI
jgi:hypothetical protein